jgi:hypothetical protein
MKAPEGLLRYWVWIVFAGTVLFGTGFPELKASQDGSRAGSTPHHPRSHSVRRSWHSGPASTPPQTEMIPIPVSPAPPATSPQLGWGWQREESPVAAAGTPAFDQPVVTISETFRATHVQPTAMRISQNRYSWPPNPEGGVRDELRRLRQDAEARRAFYDDLLGTVRSVRASARGNEASDEISAPATTPSSPH